MATRKNFNQLEWLSKLKPLTSMHDNEVVKLITNKGFSIPHLIQDELKVCHGILLSSYEDKLQEDMIKNLVRQQVYKTTYSTKDLVLNDRVDNIVKYIMHYRNIAAETFRYCNRFIVAEFYPNWKFFVNKTSRSNSTDLFLKNMIFRYNDKFWDIFYPPNYVGDQSTIIALRFDEVEPGGLSTLADVSPYPQPKDGYNINIPKKILLGY